MLFMGRRLAGRGDIAVWHEHSGAGYFLAISFYRRGDTAG